MAIQINILCNTCMYNCKQGLAECVKYDRDCSECQCWGEPLYDCPDCCWVEWVEYDEFNDI